MKSFTTLCSTKMSLAAFANRRFRPSSCSPSCSVTTGRFCLSTVQKSLPAVRSAFREGARGLEEEEDEAVPGREPDPSEERLLVEEASSRDILLSRLELQGSWEEEFGLQAWWGADRAERAWLGIWWGVERADRGWVVIVCGADLILRSVCYLAFKRGYLMKLI